MRRLHDGFVRFSAVHFFVRLAERAQAAFDLFYKPKSESALPGSGVFAHRAVHALLRHLAVPVCDLGGHGVDFDGWV